MKHLLLFTLVLSALASAGDMKAPQIGDNVPAFKLKNYDGKEYSLQTLTKDNKLVVVMFIATKCPISNKYNERMVKLNETYGEKGVAFVGINSNKAESVSEIAAHSKEHGFLFPVLKDEQNKVADAFGAQVTPETYVITPDGKLAYHGRIDDSRDPEKVQSHDLALALEALLSGKQPQNTSTKAFGCSIKRVVAD
ncbi:MAG: thioredoxin family protein [Bacteroidota bacterium]|jgi:peroxiredoxin